MIFRIRVAPSSIYLKITEHFKVPLRHSYLVESALFISASYAHILCLLWLSSLFDYETVLILAQMSALQLVTNRWSTGNNTLATDEFS